MEYGVLRPCIFQLGRRKGGFKSTE